MAAAFASNSRHKTNASVFSFFSRVFESPGPEAAVHHERLLRRGRGRGGGWCGRAPLLLLLLRLARDGVCELLLPLVPLVCAIEYALAGCLVENLQRRRSRAAG